MLRVHCAVPELRPGSRATRLLTEPGIQFNRVPGGHSEGETPGPIPNPEVKLFSADGTAREASRESRTPPEHHLTKRPAPHRGGPLLRFLTIKPASKPQLQNKVKGKNLA